MKMASVAALVPSFFILFGTAIALLVKPGLAGLLNSADLTASRRPYTPSLRPDKTMEVHLRA